jgi:carboxyl-terminal processing protease
MNGYFRRDAGNIIFIQLSKHHKALPVKPAPLLLLLLFLFTTTLFAQPLNPRNLDFESVSGGNLFPWQKSRYAKGRYFILPDSLVKHSGHSSLRISFDTVSKESTDGVIFQNIGPDVPGRQVKISAWVYQKESADTAGFISLVVSQDAGERKTAVRGKSIVGAKEWTQLSWEMSLDSFHFPLHHMRLNIGGRGTGTFWVDDILIEMDGRDMYERPSFASAAEENIKQLSGQQRTNLQMLCYVWGFLKYFHPQVAGGRFNWDNELFKMIPAVEKALSATALSDTLLAWINTLGEVGTCTECSATGLDSAFLDNVDMDWMRSHLLSNPLQKKLQQILLNRHRGNGYYARYRAVSNLEFSNEDDYANWRNIGYPHSRFRLLFLFRYWNTIHYFFPYKYVMGKDWNTELQRFIPLFATAPDITSYHLLMTEVVNSVNDSHSGITDVLVQREIAPLLLPARTVMVDERPVVVSYRDDSLGTKSGLLRGDIIEAINGEPVAKIIKRNLPLVNGSNHSVKLAYMNAYNYITGGKDSLVTLAIRRGRETVTLVVKRYDSFRPPNTLKESPWKLLHGDIGLVNMGGLEEKDIPSLFRELNESTAIIFDLRQYPRGTVYALCKYLYVKPTAFARTLVPDLNYPGGFYWKGNIVYGPQTTDSLPRYRGRVLLLVNENTQSQGEWTAMALQAVPGSVTIGSQTSGADGDVSYLLLPGGYVNKMTGLGVFYPDGTSTQRNGIKIDISVKPTIKGIREGRDELLERALTEAKR